MIYGLAATAMILISGGGWLILQQRGDPFAQCSPGQIGGGFDSLGGAFTLTDQTGARVTYADVFTKPSVLYFGYTFCPDVCPLDNQRNADAVHLLREQGVDAQPVFVTVDARRDTPEVMADFVDIFDAGMIGLTGTQDEVDKVAKLWRIYYRLNDAEDQQYYLVDHQTTSFMVMPGHGTVGLFGRDTTPEQMAERVACFVRAG